MDRTVKEDLVLRFPDSLEVFFVRRTLERPPPPAGVSPKQSLGFGHWAGGAGLVVINEMRKGQRWVDAWKLKKAAEVDCLGKGVLKGVVFPYVVEMGLGEKIAANIDELYYFAVLPPEVARLKTDDEQLQALAGWVAGYVKQREKEFLARAAANEQKRLAAQPPRLPHEDPGIDHHANQVDVMQSLLRKEWPGVAAAMNELKTAKTEAEREDWQRQKFLAYIADHTALHGKPPDVEHTEAAKLWRDTDYLRAMAKALNAPRGRVDKRDWQLVEGWMEKGYYRMSEAELEVAFARDWNYPKPIKGNTLARRARTIGLRFALKLGAPEKHKFNDTALIMRKT